MYYRKNLMTIILIAILFLLGLIVFLYPNLVINIVMLLIAFVLIAIGINFLIASREYIGKDKNKLIIESIALISASIVLIIFYRHEFMRIIIGIFFILIPLIQMIYANNKWKQFQKDIIKYIIGLILILSFDLILYILLRILGIALIGVGIYFLIILIKNRNNKECPNIMLKILLNSFLKKGGKRYEHN